jgi:hypothetical protein
MFLEGSEKYPERILGSGVQRGMIGDNHLVIEGRITKTDLRSIGCSGLSSYTRGTC